MRNRMKSNNRILVEIDKIYDNEKTIKDADGKDIKILTDAEDGNDLMVGDRHMKEWTKSNVAKIAMIPAGFSGNQELFYRGMDDKKYKMKVYQNSDIMDLRVGDSVVIQHNVSDPDNQIKLPGGDIVYNAHPSHIHCKINKDGTISPVGGYILLNKISDEKEIEKISSVILIDDSVMNRNDWDKYYGYWGSMIEQSKPLKGDKNLRIKKDDLVMFNKRFAQTVIYQEVEYWLIMPSDVWLTVKRSDFDKVKFK